MEPLKLLWLINGNGLGNSSRCLAVMRELPEFLHLVATAEGALDFFEGRAEAHHLIALPQLRYGRRQGRLSLLQSLWELGKLPRLWRLQRQILSSVSWDVAVLDSYYGPLPGDGPRLFLNSAREVVKHFRGLPRSVWSQAWLERADAWYHRGRPRCSPWFSGGCGLISRFAPRPPAATAPERILVMLSGSGLGADLQPHRWPVELPIDVLGRQGPSRPGLTYHGLVRESGPFLERAGVLVVHAGLSALSEGIALSLPMVVVPLAGHAEQWVNARQIESLGLGIMAAENEVGEALKHLLAHWQNFVRAYHNCRLDCGGAQTVAATLRKLAVGNPTGRTF